MHRILRICFFHINRDLIGIKRWAAIVFKYDSLEFSDRYLGVKIAIRTQGNFLSCLHVLFILCSWHFKPF